MPKANMPRVRASHLKSRLGCHTCKTRRVKCDEAQPACLRCVRSGRICTQQDSYSSARRQHMQFKSVHFSGPAKSFVVHDDSIMALEYFYTFTLPLFDVSEPNLLWQCLRRDGPSDQSLCYITAALGHEHMYKSQQNLLAYHEKSCRLNGRALRSMQKCLATQLPSQSTSAAFLSLLMAILQGLRGQHADMLVHLRCGSTIAQQGIKNHGITAHPQLNETLRLLRRYCISSILFDSVGIEANKTAAVMINETKLVKDLSSDWEHDEHTLLAELEIFIEELLQFMRGFRAAQHDASGNIVAIHAHARAHPCHNPSLGITLSKLAAKQTILELALEERLSAKQGAENSAVLLEFALLQCLVAKIYLRCCCYKQSFDDELPTFRRILDLERASLTVLRRTKQPLCALPFSLGLGAIGCLVSVVRLCPSKEIRQEAIQMLDLCPPTDGFWSVELARRLCITTMEFEEQLAVAESSVCLGPVPTLPRHCRVAYHSSIAASEQGDSKIRFFRRVGDTETLTCENVILSDRSTTNNAPTSVPVDRPVMEWRSWY